MTDKPGYDMAATRFFDVALNLPSGGSPALLALVQIAGISSAKVARAVELSDGEINRFMTGHDPVPLMRRREFNTMLEDAIAGLEDCLDQAVNGHLEKATFLGATEPLMRGMINTCRSLRDLEEENIKQADRDPVC